MRLRIYLGILAVFLLIFISGCANSIAPNDASIAINSENLRIAEVDLPGMFCPACASSVGNILKRMDGVVDVNIDYRAKKGTVIYDSSIMSKEQLLEDGLFVQAYGVKVLNDEEYNP